MKSESTGLPSEVELGPLVMLWFSQYYVTALISTSVLVLCIASKILKTALSNSYHTEGELQRGLLY